MPDRILIVDDDPEHSDLISTFLSARGYDVRTAPSASMALQAIRDRRPDLVLLDVCMPRVDGYRLARWLRGAPSTAPIPIIFVTALDDADGPAPFARFLAKPFHLSDLLRVVHATLDGARPEVR